MNPTAEPDGAEALRIAHDLHRSGQLTGAAEAYERVLQADPQHVDALHLSGALAFQLGDCNRAVDLIGRSLAIRPDATAYTNLAVALLALDRNDEAIAALRAALGLVPGNPQILEKLALALRKQGRDDEAAAVPGQLPTTLPETFLRHIASAQAALAHGQVDAAIPLFRQALALQPDHADALAILGALLLRQRRFAEAEPLLQHAARLLPGAAEVHGNLGILLDALGRHDEAASAFRRSLQLKQDNVAIFRIFGKMLLDRTDYEEAGAVLQQGAGVFPDDPLIGMYHCLALLNQGRHEDMRKAARAAAPAARKMLRTHSTLLYTMLCDPLCTPEQYLEEARGYGRTAAAAARPFAGWKVAPAPDTCPAPLRVGFVSGDLRSHPVGYFLENLVEHLDSRQVEPVAYSTLRREDELTDRLKSRFASWHDISHLDDAGAARKIHDDGIHILVDLAGHTTHNRLPLFAWKPAPVQVAWLGYFASTGVAAIDFILADAVSVREKDRVQFVERPWILPATRLCFTPPRGPGIPDVAPLPALASGHITFGSFQNTVKLDSPTLELWARVLHRIPDSRLRLQNVEMAKPGIRADYLQRFADLGIPAARIETTGPAPRMAYLAAHAAIDVILDTFPYPGGTTTCEALWMGVPTLTLGGDTLLSRQGASLLTAAGLKEWIAEDAQDFVERAASMTADIATLARLRAGLRTRMQESALCDGNRFAHDFTDALQAMWRTAAGSRT